MRKARRRRFKPCIPSMVRGNVGSLVNKVDQLGALIRSQREYRECSLMCFTETWMQENIPDANTTMNGFMTVQADQDHRLSGKTRGGGLALLVNNRWRHPSHITVKERICTPSNC
jgi:hypothetical protein